MKMNAVIITGNKYPLEDAGAIRQHATAKIFQSLGYNVLVLGYGKPTDGEVRTCDGVNYVSFRPVSKNKLVRALFRYFFVNRVAHYIGKNIEKIDVLLVIDVLPKDFKTIENIASKYNAKLIHDSVEWYSPEEFSDGRKNRSYRNKEFTNTVAIGKGWRVIAISKLLEEHFKTRCDKVIRIPVIMDIQSIAPNMEVHNEKRIFVYAGAPGKKDYLDTIVKSFSLLSIEEKSKVELHILGVNKEQLIKQCGVDQEDIDNLKGVLHIHGRVPHEEAVQAVMNASFTILIRDETLRYAKAGFPTKVVESLMYATPVLCNYSSDLQDYLSDRQNAIIAKGHQPEDVLSAIRSALTLPETEYSNMRTNARKTAETCFDFRQYINSLNDLLK